MTNWDEHLVARLSAKSSQMLLSLLLARRIKAVWSQAEFATVTGLPVVGWSIPGSLGVLEDHRLTTIIAYSGGVAQAVEPAQVHLAQEEYHGEQAEVTSTEGAPVLIKPPVHLLPPTPGSTLAGGRGEGAGELGDAEVRGGVRVPEGGGEVRGGGLKPERPQTDSAPEQDVGFDEKLARLREAWDVSFPAKDYAFQRLTRDGARRLLSGGRTVDEVRDAILEAPKQAKSKIQSPLSYVLAVLQGMARKDAQSESASEEDGVGITDELRRLTEMGRRLYAPKTKDGG